MEKVEKENWLKLYYFVNEIAHWTPWTLISPEIPVVIADKEHNVIFSILGNKGGGCGFSCFLDAGGYALFHERIKLGNPKKEPLALLQNSYVGVFGKKADVSEANRKILEEASISFADENSWFAFEKYTRGYFPEPLKADDVKALLDATGNLYMLLKHVNDGTLKFDPEKDKALFRLFDYEKKQWRNYVPDKAPEFKAVYPQITINQDPKTGRETQTVVEVDWAFVPMKLKEPKTDKDCLPLLMTIAEHATGYAYDTRFIPPSQDAYGSLLFAIDNYVEKYGRPKEIMICERELAGVLDDYCKKASIKLTLKDKLPMSQNARNKVALEIKQKAQEKAEAEKNK